MARNRLLYFINHMDWFWSHRAPLAIAAQDAGWQVMIAAPGAGRDTGLDERGFTGFDLPDPSATPAPVNALATIREMRRLIATLDPTLCHAITLKYAFLAGLAARARPQMPIVHTVAGLGYLFWGEGVKPALLRQMLMPLLKPALGHSSAYIIVQNPDDRDRLLKLGIADARRTSLIRGSGVDLTRFQPVARAPDAPPRIVMATRLIREKGVAVFVEAAKLSAAAGIAAEWVIAGGVSASNPNAMTEAEMRGLLNGAPVRWLGHVDDTNALYSSATLFAYPSYYGEGIPKVLLEAAASGLPIVTTDHPGCREVVDSGKNGLLIPVKDPQALARAVEGLLKDPARCRQMEQESRKKAEREFGAELITSQTLEVYDTVTAT